MTWFAQRVHPAVALLAAIPLLLALVLARADVPAALERAGEPASAKSYGKLPLSFVPNEGQTDSRVHFHSQGADLSAFFTNDGARLSVGGKGRSGVVDLRFVGASAHVAPIAERPRPGKVNFLIGERSNWRRNLPTYGAITYRDLWPGIDLRFVGARGKLKYELALAPGADPSRIGLAYAGADSLAVTRAGDLRVHTRAGSITDSRPVAYQLVGGRRVPVESRFRPDGGSRYGFELGPYDSGRPLLIDPALEYSTFLGHGRMQAIAVDAAGSAYVTGEGFAPTTPGAYDETPNGDIADAFVTKFSPDGSSLVYSTVVGGWSGPSGLGDGGMSIALDPAGGAYIAGYTSAPDFPVTPGAYMTSGGTVFAAKLSPDGSSLDYSTFVGGEGLYPEIAVDESGNAFVTGHTTGALPTTAGAYDTTFNGGFDAFVVKLNPTGTAALFSTYLGGTLNDRAYGVALDAAGNAFVTGQARPGFPVTPGAYATTFDAGQTDAFVSKLSADGSTLLYSTGLGGSDRDYGSGIAVDSAAQAYVTGRTTSTDFPTTPGAYATGDIGSGFATKLNATGSALSYSTFLAGNDNPDESVAERGIAVDQRGNAYVAGDIASATLSTTPDAYDATFSSGPAEADGYVLKLTPDGSALRYASYLGGSDGEAGFDLAIDGRGDAYVSGYTASGDFPTTPGAFDTTHNGATTAFITKFDLSGRVIVVKDVVPDDTQNFTFSAGGGLSPSSFQLDDDANATLSNTRVFDVPGASGYSLSETPPAGWYLADVRCDNGSPVSNIDVDEGETVTCTFTNARTYPRPGGATPLRVPLVPAYRVCQLANANSEHVAPLDEPSCSPPVQASEVLTTSSTGRGSGFARFDVAAGNPATSLDEADVGVLTRATDVKNASDGTDYVGKVILTTTVMRLTDRANTPTGNVSGTMEDLEFSLPVDCLSTPDPAVGSTCEVQSTFDTLVPGSVIEGKRAVVRIAAAKIKDAGADGNILPPAGGFGCPPSCGSGDERTFLEQGVFAP